MKPSERKQIFKEIFGETLSANGYAMKGRVYYKVDYENKMLKFVYMVSYLAGHAMKICFEIVPFILRADPNLPQRRTYETFTLDDVVLAVKGKRGITFTADCFLPEDFKRTVEGAFDEFKKVLLEPLNQINNLQMYIEFMETMFPDYGMASDRGIMCYLANGEEQKARRVAQNKIERIQTIILDDVELMSILTEQKKNEYLGYIAQLERELKNGFRTYRAQIEENERLSFQLNHDYFDKRRKKKAVSPSTSTEN